MRCIPVPSILLWILREYGWTAGDLVIRPYSDYTGYSSAVRKALKLWSPESYIPTKDFRNTLITTAIDNGWWGYYAQRYVGHAPQTTGERHYHGDQGKRLVKHFREKVLNHVEAEINGWDSPGRVLPGPRIVSLMHG